MLAKLTPANARPAKWIFAAALAGASLGCATAARFTLEDRFRALGIPDQMAGCLVDEADARLDDQDLQALARYSLNVARQSTTIGTIRALTKIDNPRAARAIGEAGLVCVTGFGR